ncbi:LysR family transcriptional regulator [Gordonia sp. NPDC003376]
MRVSVDREYRVQFAHLQVFLAVVEEGSFAAAARKLWISPSRATERVQQLERSLGVSLLDRSSRRLEPTQAGLALVPRAQAVAREFELIRALFPEDRDTGLRVGMRSLPLPFRERVRVLLERAVGVDRLTILPLDTRTQLNLLDTARLDCGFIWSVPPEPIATVPILSERLAVAVPAASPQAAHSVIHPRDLAGLRLASIVDPMTIPADLGSFLEYLPQVDIVNAAVANALYMLVSGGKHCAFVPAETTEHASLSSETRRNVVVKPLAEPVPTLCTHLAWRGDLEQAPLLAAAVTQFEHTFREPEVH